MAKSSESVRGMLFHAKLTKGNYAHRSMAVGVLALPVKRRCWSGRLRRHRVCSTHISELLAENLFPSGIINRAGL